MIAQPEDTLSSRYSLDDNGRVRDALANDAVLGIYKPEQRRFEWDLSAMCVDPKLAAGVAEEARLWDDWAEITAQGTSSQPFVRKEKHTKAGWLLRYPTIDRALKSAGITLDLAGKTILDVGGSGKDLVYWLSEAPGRIDHVEVSPRSQALCLKNLTDLKVLQSVPVFFHTIPAEFLPFDENTYDFIFSRSTLHHCVRPDVLDEIFRVLKPGGSLLFAENFRGDFFYNVMRFDRWVRRRDRGTDDPLRKCHLRYCEEQYATSGKAFSSSVFGILPRLRTFSAGPGTGMHVCFAGRK